MKRKFEARFNRVARNVSVPIGNVTAIYAAENGHGMAFEVPKALAVVEPKAPRTARGLRDVTPAAETADTPQEGAQAESSPVELSSVPGTRRRTTKSSPVSTPTDAAPPAMSLVPGGSASREAPPPPVLVESTPSDQPQPEAESTAPVTEPPDGGDDPSPSSPPARKGGRARLTRVK